jgi:hypothetical protein
MIYTTADGLSYEMRYQCMVCGKMTAGRKPRRGDLSEIYPRVHAAAGKPKGTICDGTYSYSRWVDTPVGHSEKEILICEPTDTEEGR